MDSKRKISGRVNNASESRSVGGSKLAKIEAELDRIRRHHPRTLQKIEFPKFWQKIIPLWDKIPKPKIKIKFIVFWKKKKKEEDKKDNKGLRV